MAKQTSTLNEPANAIMMLKTDHQRVRDLFQTYEHSHDPHLRQQMAAHLLVALELYTLLEATVFFPAVAEETEQKEVALDAEAREEPQRIRELIAVLRTCDSEDVAGDPHLQALMNYVSHHV